MAISDIPGLAGFVAGKEENERVSANNLQNAAGALSLAGMIRQQQEQEGFRRDLAALGPEPSQEQVTAVASKYADPKSLLAIHQQSLDRKEQAKDRALRFAQEMSVRQGQLDLHRDQFNQRTTDAAAKQQFEEWYKGETLRNRSQMDQLNGQLRLMGLEIQRQGQQIQVQNFNAAESARREREIEGAIGKTSDRMKDVTPVMTAARQLNDTLSLYTPENVPGVGYWKNTGIGKMGLSQQGKDVSSSIKLFGNAVLKAMSGQAVTAPEEVRQMAAQMADGRFSAEDFFIAWPKMASWVNDQVSLSTAGLTPAARERFIDRTGLKLDPISPRFTFDQQAGKLVDSRAAPAPGSLLIMDGYQFPSQKALDDYKKAKGIK